MSADVLQVERLLEVFRSGSSTPALALGSDGARWVVKLNGAAAGVEALILEFMVNRLSRLAGLPVPDTRLIHLPEGFPWQVGTDEFDDVVRRSPGWNLAIAFVPDAREVARDELSSLPAGFLSQVATIDRCFRNLDRSPAHSNLLREPGGRLWAIDHGSCQFLRAGDDFSLSPHHFLDESPPLQRIELPSGGIDEVCARLPGEWLEEAGIARDTLRTRLAKRIGAFNLLSV